MGLYCNLQSVLQEAGLWQRELGETASGTVNATNKVFTTTHKPLADNNYDDTVDENDVAVYVNGVPVSVVSINSATGACTLASAPANGTTVTIDYSYAALPLDYVEDLVDEADDWINEELDQVVTTPFKSGKVPATIRKIARTYAAGLLMAREYGLQHSTDDSKEGDRKIKQAEAWMTAYRTRLMGNGEDTLGQVVPRSTSSGQLFQRFDSTTSSWTPLADEGFRLNEAD